MATRNANNTDFGTQFGGTTLTVFDIPSEPSGADAQTALLSRYGKVSKQYKSLNFFATWCV